MHFQEGTETDDCLLCLYSETWQWFSGRRLRLFS